MRGRLLVWALLVLPPVALLAGLATARADVLPTAVPSAPPLAVPASPTLPLTLPTATPSLPVSVPSPTPSLPVSKPTSLPGAPAGGSLVPSPGSSPQASPAAPGAVSAPTPPGPAPTPSLGRQPAPLTSAGTGISTVIGPLLARPLSARVPLFPVLLPLLAGLLLLTLSAIVAAYRRTEEARRLRELEHAKTEFINLVSHELRTPLTVIRGYMAMIRDGDVAPGTKQFDRVLPLVTSRVDQVAILVEQMIDAARLDGGDAELVISNVDLRDVVTDVMLAMRRAPGEPHVITYDLPAHPVPVEVDRHRLISILEQLIDNAIKYSPAGGEINVSVAVDGARTAVEVTDHGIGIAESDLPKLFTRFGRLVTPDNSHVLGAGLGLYLSREMVRRQGGDIGVRSRKGVGSTFTLTLPLSKPASEPRPEPAPKPAIT